MMSNLSFSNKYMSCSTSKPTLWTLRNVSTQISLHSPPRQNWADRPDTFHIRGIEVQSIIISETENTQEEKNVCPGKHARTVQADLSSIHYAESIMLVFSWDGSCIFFSVPILLLLFAKVFIDSMLSIWKNLLLDLVFQERGLP